MRRVLIYAAIYGAIGALVGACVALYTKDVENVAATILPLKRSVLQNGSSTAKASKTHSSSSSNGSAETVEPVTPTSLTRED